MECGARIRAVSYKRTQTTASSTPSETLGYTVFGKLRRCTPVSEVSSNPLQQIPVCRDLWDKRGQFRPREDAQMITYLFLAGLVATIALLVAAGTEESFEAGFRV
jgi:hypothetical protein